MITPPTDGPDHAAQPTLTGPPPRMNLRRARLAELHPDPANARKHDGRNLDAISASLKQFGQVEPLVVQKSTGKVIGGNGRLEVLRRAGETECDIVEVDVDDVQAAALGIALNRTSELAEWNDEALAKLLRSLPEDAFAATGFDADDLGELLDKLAPVEVAEDEVPLPPDEAVTQMGDLYILGDHRLLCGDSSSAADLDRLLAGQPIHLVNTDPPYNVKVEPRSNNAIAAGLSSFSAPESRHPEPSQPRKLRAKDRPLANDFVSDEEFERLLHAWFGNLSRVLIPGGGFYIWGGYANCGNYPPVLKAAGLYFSQAIIWDKQHPVLTRKDFMGAHEWCFYGWKEGAAHRYFGPANATDLWQVKKVNPNAMVHLTEKPVELAARAMQYSSRRGEHVLDLFGGSGSTLMAAEQTGRKAFLMELDPPYCDVICDRYQRLTGRPALRERTGDAPIPMRAREENMP